MTARPYSRRQGLLGPIGFAAANSCRFMEAFGAEATGPAARPNKGRPHTDFIYSQVAYGRVLGPDNSRPGVPSGILAYDKGSGAITVMFRYPPGWNFAREHYNDSDEEILLLEGDLTLDGLTYRTGDYAYLPAGLVRHAMSSDEGATVLTCYEGEHKNIYAAPPAGSFDKTRMMAKASSGALQWKPVDAKRAGFHGAKEKVLREDKTSGERTTLLQVPADDTKRTKTRPAATYAAVHEIYVISGEISTPHGVMRSGAFAWQLPGRAIGPVGTRTGFTAWVRNKGGPQQVSWSHDQTAIAWDAPYDPEIPPDMRDFAFKTFPAAQKY